MTSPSEQPQIVDADRAENGVLIAFSDGQVAIFSASFLYANLSSAIQTAPESVE